MQIFLEPTQDEQKAKMPPPPPDTSHTVLIDDGNKEIMMTSDDAIAAAAAVVVDASVVTYSNHAGRTRSTAEATATSPFVTDPTTGSYSCELDDDDTGMFAPV
jgi:uncharacterized protein (DUF2252 family)